MARDPGSASWTGVGGKLVSLGTFGNRGEAQAAKEAAEASTAAGLVPDAVQSREITLGWVLDRFQESPVKVSKPSDPVKPGTVAQYLAYGKVLTDILGRETTLPNLTKHSVTKLPELVEALKARGYGANTVNQHLKLLSTIYKLGAHYGKLPTDIPSPSVGRHFMTVPKQEKIAFNASHVKALIAGAPNNFRAFIMLAAFTGMRVSEIRGLQRNHVGLTKGIVSVRQQGGTTSDSFVELKTTEAGKRDLHIPKAVVLELTKHLAATKAYRDKRPDLNLIFPTRNGTMYHAANITNREWTDTKRNATLSVLSEAMGDFDRSAMTEHAEHAKNEARTAAENAGKKVGTVIDAGHKAYFEAQVSYMVERLDEEHPAVHAAYLFGMADFHHLRRSFATQLFIETGNIVQVAQALGDSVQTVLNTYIISSPETEAKIKTATENLYAESEGGILVEVDTDMANRIVAEYQKDIRETEGKTAALEAENAAMEAENAELESALGRLGTSKTDLDALQAATEALEGASSLTEALATLSPEVKGNRAVKELLDSRLAEEERERLEYERLKAKFG